MNDIDFSKGHVTEFLSILEKWHDDAMRTVQHHEALLSYLQSKEQPGVAMTDLAWSIRHDRLDHESARRTYRDLRRHL